VTSRPRIAAPAAHESDTNFDFMLSLFLSAFELDWFHINRKRKACLHYCNFTQKRNPFRRSPSAGRSGRRRRALSEALQSFSFGREPRCSGFGDYVSQDRRGPQFPRGRTSFNIGSRSAAPRPGTA
jgi:hypothetical protein